MDHVAEPRDLKAQVFGLSTLDADYQQEATQRIELSYPLVSEENLGFIRALSLPIMEPEFK